MGIGPIANSSWQYANYGSPYSATQTPRDGGGGTSSPHAVTPGDDNTAGPGSAKGMSGCPACESRRYVDGSSDPGVSFKSPTRVPNGAAAATVRSHEQEHVSRDAARAREAGGRVLSQTVTIQTAVCPSCGRSYVAGGRTRTVMSVPVEPPQTASSSKHGRNALGGKLDLTM